jgi:hypothetical protein
MSNPFTLISSKIVYKNPWISVREDAVIRPGWKEWIFWVVTAKPGSTVLAIDEHNNIFITNEYHYAVAEQKIELISWWKDENESFLECAKRELEEEAWLLADEWIELGYIDPFSGIIDCKNYIYLARKLRPSVSNPDEWEIVNISKISYEEALKKAYNSEISHWASVVAILKAEKYINL